MYRGGMKPDLIAHERNLALSTVFGHLARYLDSGQVDLDDLVPTEHRQAINAAIRKVGTGDATAIKVLCPPEVTYHEIRLLLDRPSTPL